MKPKTILKALKICRTNSGYWSRVGVVFALPTFVFFNRIEGVYPVIPPQNLACGENCSVCTPKQLKTLAQAITVKIFSEQGWGSGILLHQQGTTYTLVTNQHVVFSHQPTYKIQAPDGQFYLARFHSSLGLSQSDLAILKFDSLGKNYAIASLAFSKEIAIGDKVFGGGFPWESASLTEKLDESYPTQKKGLSKFTLASNLVAKSQTGSFHNVNFKSSRNSKFSQPNFQPPERLGFRLTQGRISLLPEKAIQKGYQIGYTNSIQKGMSGGPLLNHQGQLIGINGMHAYPLWDNPYTYEDGSQPSPILQKQMSEFAFAIPVERLRDLTLGLTSLLPNQVYLNDQAYSLPLINPVRFPQRPSTIRGNATNSQFRSSTKLKDGETSCELSQPTDADDPGV